MPLGAFVRALHNADVRRHDVANWMNQFAVAPEQGHGGSAFGIGGASARSVGFGTVDVGKGTAKNL